MPLQIPRARPPLRYLAPRFSAPIHAAVRAVSGAYLRLGLKIDRVETVGLRSLAESYAGMKQGRHRLLIVFRHPHPDDGPVLFRLLSVLLPRAARREGIELGRVTGASFVYSRDVPVWAGAVAAFLFPRAGGIPVLLGRYDSRALRDMREALANGRFPLAIAPEAQVTYHAERAAAMEPGAAQLAFWCREDLDRQGRTDEDVLILPLTTRYRYGNGDPRKLDRFLGRLEARCGISSPETAPGTADRPARRDRMMRILGHLLDRMEAFYDGADPSGPSGGRPEPTDGTVGPPDDGQLQERIDRMVDAALSTAERAFSLEPAADAIQRVFAVRQAGLERIFRPDLPDPARLAPLERALADRIAAEAFLTLRHLELADVLAYVRPDYLPPEASFDRCVEFAVNLHDIVSRLSGGSIAGRIEPYRKTATVVVGKPIPLSSRLAGYAGNRKLAVTRLTDELAARLQELSEPGRVGRPLSPRNRTNLPNRANRLRSEEPRSPGIPLARGLYGGSSRSVPFSGGTSCDIGTCRFPSSFFLFSCSFRLSFPRRPGRRRDSGESSIRTSGTRSRTSSAGTAVSRSKTSG